MGLFTGCMFDQKLWALQNDGDIKIYAVTRGRPRCPHEQWVTAVSPSWRLVNGIKKGTISHDEYTQSYLQEMSTSVAREAMRLIRENALIDDIYIVCFEREGDFCHRHILKELIEALP